MRTGTDCAARAARPSATMSTPARSAACWPTRSCSISTTKRGFPFRIAGSRANAIFLKELRGLSFLELWRDADRDETRFGSALRRRRSAGFPHRRRGPAAWSWRGGHRGHSAAASPSWIDPFPRPRRLRRPCRARVDGPHRGRTDRAHLAARARFVDAQSRRRRRARRRPAFRFARPPSVTNICLSIPATGPRPDACDMPSA